MSDSVVLTEIPVPPSSNNQYMIIRRGGKSYHIPSKELQDFRSRMEAWASQFYREIVLAKNQIHDWTTDKYTLAIHCKFNFQQKRVYTKEGKIRKMDVSNRIKAIHDVLAKLLGVDDSVFFLVSAEKCVSDEEMVVVEIGKHGV